MLIKNKAGGKTSLENYQASADSQILLRIENEDQVDGLYDPFFLQLLAQQIYQQKHQQPLPELQKKLKCLFGFQIK